MQVHGMEGKQKVGVTEVCLEDQADGGKTRDRRLEHGCHSTMGDLSTWSWMS